MLVQVTGILDFIFTFSIFHVSSFLSPLLNKQKRLFETGNTYSGNDCTFVFTASRGKLAGGDLYLVSSLYRKEMGICANWERIAGKKMQNPKQSHY